MVTFPTRMPIYLPAFAFHALEKLLYQDWLSLTSPLTPHCCKRWNIPDAPSWRRALFPVPCQEGSCHSPEGLGKYKHLTLLVAGWA